MMSNKVMERRDKKKTMTLQIPQITLKSIRISSAYTSNGDIQLSLEPLIVLNVSYS